MDIEEFMVLISTILSCVFVGLQLYHVKKHPNVLPFMSLTMMSILTFGHMIPLILNFEALFSHQNPNNNNNNNYAFGPLGWLKVGEIDIRLVTMLAFWFHFRLLQLTWSSRNTENENSKALWDAELKVSLATLYLYVSGLLLLFPLLFMLKEDREENLPVYHHLKSYGGSIMDGFLLPQIILNEFSDMSTQNVLSCSFYFGTTFVRLLPHAYDLVRTLNYVCLGNGSYASVKADFICIIWNIVIPLVGIAFAIIVSIQQHYGPHYILPQRLEGSNVCERVAVVVESEEAKAEAEVEAEKIDKENNAVFYDKCKLPDDHGESNLDNS